MGLDWYARRVRSTSAARLAGGTAGARFRHLLNLPQQEHIPRDSAQKDYGCGSERASERIRWAREIAGQNWRDDTRYLVPEIDDSTDAADAIARRDERWNGPGHRRCRG